MSKIALTPNASGTGVFTISSPATSTDRTLTLPDEAGTVLTSVSSLASANLTGSLPAISGADLTSLPENGVGVGQTWADFTSSRSSGVTYTNSTGKPIYVFARYGVGAVDLTLQIDSIYINFSNNNGRGGVSGIIPNGSTYIITGTFNVWNELR
mgnify:CR=1 FL=1|tara:strand:+ start:1434 stop:1895 length:462 start_codon:yes stop_codon:yes gene_type:complete